jgi:spermidine synthase
MTSIPSPARSVFDLALISGVILFLELACIRWFPAHVLFLSFFTNAVLLASFVGMSVGCLVARRPRRLLFDTPGWLAVVLTLGLVVETLRSRVESYVTVADQNSGEVVFFGAEQSAMHQMEFAVPVELVAGAFFALIAMVLVGPGQEMGRAFNRVANRTTAYAANLAGSLAGIGLFAVCSTWQLPPPVWFGAVALGIAYFLFRPTAGEPARSRRLPIVYLAAAVAVSSWTSGWYTQPNRPTFQTSWSPYYRIDYHNLPKTTDSDEQKVIITNLVSHQAMIERGTNHAAQYELPYVIRNEVNRHAGRDAWPEFNRVLVIGAGSGNDIARVLAWCPNATIDAVEIDPVIQSLGKKDHPNRPYDDPRVTVHLNDGRNFLRTAAPDTYDLVIYALVDSLVLHSGYSNLRLESYLFTEEAFRDVKRALKPTGTFVVYNFFRQGWLVGRIRDEMRTAFDGSVPVVFTFPRRDVVNMDGLDHGFTLFFAGPAPTTDALRAAFADRALKVPVGVGLTPETKGIGLVPRAEAAGTGVATLAYLYPSEVPPTDDLRPATDDWPFLYVKTPAIPAHTWRGIGVMLLLSLAVWWMASAYAGRIAPTGPAADVSGKDLGLAARSFCLGAGFMLIETKAVVHMALLFGGTWTVNTIVFAAVLVMSLIGNLIAGMLKPRNLAPWYAVLFATLALNVAIPTDTFLGMDRAVQMVCACGLAFAPVAVAGIIFAVTFGRARKPDTVFGANVAGALVGGLAENASMLLGFRLLGVVAAGFYVLSAFFGSREVPRDNAGTLL